MYLEDSSWPIPSWYKDYVGLAEISIRDYGPIVIEDPIELELLESAEGQ